MVSVFQFDKYNSFLKEELNRRTVRNPKYSIRAFARDLNVSFSRLSEIISKDEAITLTTAAKIADSLQMSSLEKEYFQNLILAKHGRDTETRDQALEKIRSFKLKRQYATLNDKYSGIFTKWFYLPLIEMMILSTPPTLEEAGRSLHVSVDEIKQALNHLVELGHIKKTSQGGWKKTSLFLKIESKVPSKNIKDFHKNMLALAHKAISEQPIESRKNLSNVFSVNKDRIEEARKELESFNQAFIEKYAADNSGDAVYSFCLQLFQIDTARDIQ